MWIDVLSMKKRTLEAVEDAVAQKLEAAGLWRRASVRWLEIMGNGEYTEAQREWVLLRREYCLAQILPLSPPEKMDVSEVARAADAALRQMGIVTPSGKNMLV